MAFFSKARKAVDKATTDDQVPCAGYLLEDVARLTHESADTCNTVREYCLKRIDKSSPHIKVKVLRVIKVVLEKGHPSFRADLKRSTEKIRACTTYNAAPDLLHGDTFIKQVRETAAAVLQDLFDTVPSTHSTTKSFGRTDSGTLQPSFAAGGGPSGAPSKMYGYENPNSDRGSAVAVRPGMPSTPARHGGFDRQYGSQDSSDPYVAPEGRILSGHAASGERPKAEEGAEHERRLVEAITEPGGVRAAPPRDALMQFCRQCSGLDIEAVAQVLEERIDSTSWQTRLKALYVVEALVKQGFTRVAEFFAEDAGAIEEAAESPQASLKAVAKRVLALLSRVPPSESAPAPTPLGVASSPPKMVDVGLAPAPAPVPAPEARADLLGGVFDAPAPTATASPPPAATAPRRLDPLAETFSAEATVAAAAEPGGLFAGLVPLGSTSPAPAPAQREPRRSQSAQADLFEGMSVASASAASPAYRVREVEVMESPGGSLFDGLSTATADGSMRDETIFDAPGGMFSGLTLSGEAASPAITPGSNGSEPSGFAFMNSGGPVDAPAPLPLQSAAPAPLPLQSAPVKQDLLSSLDPPSPIPSNSATPQRRGQAMNGGLAPGEEKKEEADAFSFVSTEVKSLRTGGARV